MAEPSLMKWKFTRLDDAEMLCVFRGEGWRLFANLFGIPGGGWRVVLRFCGHCGEEIPYSTSTPLERPTASLLSAIRGMERRLTASDWGTVCLAVEELERVDAFLKERGA